jgi:hypothetical protein
MTEQDDEEEDDLNTMIQEAKKGMPQINMSKKTPKKLPPSDKNLRPNVSEIKQKSYL